MAADEGHEHLAGPERTFYRLDVSLNHGEDIIQLADWLISNGDPLPPPGR